MRLTCALALFLSACGGGSKSAPAPEAPVAEAKPAPPPEPPKPDPTIAEQKVADRILECQRPLNMKDLAAIAECYSATAETTHAGNPDKATGGKEAAEKFYQPFFDGFPDLQIRAPLVLVNGNHAAVVMHAYGMNAGPMMGNKPTNKTIGLYGLRFVDVEDGKIARDVHVFDPATLLTQIGKIKGPARKMAEPPTGEPTVVLARDTETERANVEVVKSICNGFNKQDAAAILALLADDVVWSDQTSPADLEGKAAVEAELKAILTAFPDISVNCEAWGAGDHVANLASWTATNKGAWKEVGIPKATNKSVMVTDGEIFEVKDGKVKKYWRFSNGLAMANQLGLVPAPKTGKKK
jgi:steroid delta-isomerase-like uncharacterized protein